MTVNRLPKLRSLIAEKELDALLVSRPENYGYLSGFSGSSGWLIISCDTAILATDSRYTEQARLETTGFEVILVKQGLVSWLPALLSSMSWHKLGFEADHICYSNYHKLSEALKTKQLNTELIPTSGLVESLRSIKEAPELELITKAAELVDAVFDQAKAAIRPGITEKEAAWQIEQLLRQGGSEAVPFEIIVASGFNSALPHARPTERIIQPGEPVLIDMGARVGDYCSDFTRTICFGSADKTLQKIHSTVLAAQLAAIDGIRSGMPAAEADKLARDVIEQAGYGNAFGHSLGHGLGRVIHELPTLSSISTDVLADNMVFTIEPGIYINGYGGVRIEDTVTLEKGRVKLLTMSEKTL